MGTGERPPTAIASGDGDGRRGQRFAFAAAALIAYTVAFVPLYRIVGPGTEAFAAAVVLIAAFGLGRNAGLLAACLCIVVHVTGYVSSLSFGLSDVLSGGAMPANLLLPLLGFVVGHLRELRQDLEREVRERNETERRLIRARKEAEAANSAKGDFLARMSHEIRTPMNGVIGLSQLVLQAEINGEERKYVEMIQSSANTLLLIINDILDFSKVEAGRLEIDEVDFDLLPVVADVMNIMAMQASQKGVELALRKPAGLPERVHGDRGRLRQVLLNLVGNAIKFSPAGEVVVELAVVVHEEERAIVRFEVRDRGIGIAADALNRIFQPFRQADSSTTQRYGGTGLGLAISKQLVELMGGRIGCDSVPGRGSTFWFEVPFARRAAVVDDEELPGEVERLRHARVLVVADRVHDDALLTRLRSFDMLVDRADGVDAGLSQLQRAAGMGEPFAMCVVACRTPAEWTLAFGRRVRAKPEHDRVAMVLLTADEPEGSSGDVERAGYAGWFAQSIDQVSLCEGLVAALAVPRRRSGGRRDEFMVTRHRMNERRARHIAHVLVAEDNRVNQIIAKKLLEKMGLQVDVVDNGRQAVAAAAEKSYDAIFMDCRMPELDGLAATAAIRIQEETEGGHTPIIALTAAAMQGDREACLAAGMDDHVTKPIDPDALSRAVSRWIPVRRRAAGQSGFGSGARMSSLPVEPSVLAQLREAGGPEVVAVAVGGFLDAASPAISDLRLAARAGDANTLGFVAHRFKGTCGAVGARQMADICHQLELTDPSADPGPALQLIERLGVAYQLAAETLAGYRDAGPAGQSAPEAPPRGGAV